MSKKRAASHTPTDTVEQQALEFVRNILAQAEAVAPKGSDAYWDALFVYVYGQLHGGAPRPVLDRDDDQTQGGG